MLSVVIVRVCGRSSNHRRLDLARLYLNLPRRDYWMPRLKRGKTSERHERAISLHCASSRHGGPSRSTRSARLAGYPGGQVINSGEEQLQDRRSIRLVVADNQVDGWGLSLDRTAGHRPRKKIIWEDGQQRYGAGRRD